MLYTTEYSCCSARMGGRLANLLNKLSSVCGSIFDSCLFFFFFFLFDSSVEDFC